MDAQQIRRELEALVASPNFNDESSSLADDWAAAGVGLAAVEPILQFMESHPEIDFGMPGGLVHFVERLHRQGYEELLVNSVLRRPTWITTWMLNRVINGTRSAASRRRYIQALREAAAHPQADLGTIEQVQRFLSRL